MDIIFNKPLGYDELLCFLEKQFPERTISLVYDGVNDGLNLPKQTFIFHYIVNNDIAEGFKYGLDVYKHDDDAIELIENLSLKLTEHFYCSAFCDASRIILKESNHLYSLLFKQGRVYLADDSLYEETGKVLPVVELAYQLPDCKPA
ncbi:MAG: hypothetical protein MI865_01125 [Proteobacteria bacterium]|nr:hypothetical protein [Pseudomonadota bacterium]